MDYDVAPDVAMGVGSFTDADKLLRVVFEQRPVVDRLLSYGWAERPGYEGAESFAISQKHPRFNELKEAGRIEGEDPEHKGHWFVSKADAPVYKTKDFVIIWRRGTDPADVMANVPEIELCDHDAHKPCPLAKQGWRCYKNRFADRYEAWRKGLEHDIGDGLPLGEVPFLAPAMREMLKHRGVFTAEQLCDLPADVAAHLPGAVQLQQRVQKFLDAIKGQREDAKLEAKLVERDERIAALEAKLAELLTRPDPNLAPPPEPPRKGSKFA